MEMKFAILMLGVLVVTCMSLHSTQSDSDSTVDYYPHYPSSVPTFLAVPVNITVHEGETAKLRCRIHNLGPKTVTWRKANEDFPLTVGERSFTPNTKIKVEAEEFLETEEDWYDLIIKDVQQDQAGMYECIVSAMENYTQNVTLHVLGPVEYKPEKCSCMEILTEPIDIGVYIAAPDRCDLKPCPFGEDCCCAI